MLRAHLGTFKHSTGHLVSLHGQIVAEKATSGGRRAIVARVELLSADDQYRWLNISFIVGEALKDESKRDMKRCDDLVTECFKSADYEEGRAAFMEKRKPAFKGQ